MEEKYHSLHSNFLPSAITVMDWSNTYMQVFVMIITLSDSELLYLSLMRYSPCADLFTNCRALEPLILPSEPGQVVKERLLNFVRSLSTVLAFAYCLSRYACFLAFI